MAIALFIDDLADFIISESTTGLALGEDLWLGDMPDEVVFGTWLKDAGSQVNDPVIIDRNATTDIAESHFRDHLAQVLTRGGRYDMVHEMQWKIYLTLHGRANFTLGNFYCQGIEALNIPQVVSGDADEAWIFSTTYACLIRDDSTI